MNTILYHKPQDIPKIAALLQDGQAVGIPTETVYGLAANGLDSAAVMKIFAAKHRPADNPLILHISRVKQLADLVTNIPPAAYHLIDAFWPGPLTLVLPRSKQVPDAVTAGGDTVAVRMPSHPVAQAIINACDLPLAAPSANRSGSPSPTTAAHVMADLAGVIPAVFDGGPCKVGVESTVLSLTGKRPRLLRPGGITPEQLEQITGPIDLDPSITSNIHLSHVSSPGMKYKHYAPKAKVILLHGSSDAFIAYVNTCCIPGTFALCFAEEADRIHMPTVCLGHENQGAEMARNLFACLRQLDQQGASQVLAHCPPRQGVGLAVYNRLIRAAAFDERELNET